MSKAKWPSCETPISSLLQVMQSCSRSRHSGGHPLVYLSPIFGHLNIPSRRASSSRYQTTSASVSVNKPPLRQRRDFVEHRILESRDLSPQHSIDSSPLEPPSNDNCANTNSSGLLSDLSTQPTLSEANPYNPGVFYVNYKNEIETRLFLGQCLTESQLEWLRFPTVELPIPIGEIKLVYNLYQENGLPVVSGNDLVPGLEENGHLLTPSSPSLLSSSLEEESESDDASSTSSEIMTPVITADCEALVTALAQELSALDLGPDMPAADINDQDMAENTFAEETWEMPISPTGSVASLMYLTGSDIPPFALEDTEIENEFFAISEPSNALKGPDQQVSVNTVGAAHPIHSLLQFPQPTSITGRSIKPLRKKLQGSPLKDVIQDVEMSTAAPQVEIATASTPGPTGRKVIGLRRNRQTVPSPLSMEL